MKYESVSPLCINFDVYHYTTMARVTAKSVRTSRQREKFVIGKDTRS